MRAAPRGVVEVKVYRIKVRHYANGKVRIEGLADMPNSLLLKLGWTTHGWGE